MVSSDVTHLAGHLMNELLFLLQTQLVVVLYFRSVVYMNPLNNRFMPPRRFGMYFKFTFLSPIQWNISKTANNEREMNYECVVMQFSCQTMRNSKDVSVWFLVLFDFFIQFFGFHRIAELCNEFIVSLRWLRHKNSFLNGRLTGFVGVFGDRRVFVCGTCANFSTPFDFLPFRSMGMLLNAHWIPIRTQDQARFATILSASDAAPIGSAVFPIQIAVDHNQGTAALTVNEIHMLVNTLKSQKNPN